MPGVQSWKKIPKIPKNYFETYQCSVVKRSEIKLFQVQAACNSENGSIYSSYRFNFRTSIVRLFAIMITLDSVLNSSCLSQVESMRFTVDLYTRILDGWCPVILDQKIIRGKDFAIKASIYTSYIQKNYRDSKMSCRYQGSTDRLAKF